MRINVGTKEKGYIAVTKNHEDILKHYLDNVANRYEGSFVERNKELANDWLNRKNLLKYTGFATATTLFCATLLGMALGDPTFATSGVINLDPLTRFFNEVYWSLFRIAMMIATPVWGWVGLILLTGGANSEKRTQAKKVATGLVVGTGITASAPYLTKLIYGAWTFFKS